MIVRISSLTAFVRIYAFWHRPPTNHCDPSGVSIECLLRCWAWEMKGKWMEYSIYEIYLLEYLPCHCDYFVDVWQKAASFKQQWQIEHHKIGAKEKILDNLLINIVMYLWMCDIIQQFALLNVVECNLAKFKPVDFAVLFEYLVACGLNINYYVILLESIHMNRDRIYICDILKGKSGLHIYEAPYILARASSQHVICIWTWNWTTYISFVYTMYEYLYII